MKTVGVIGGGAAGALVAINLLRRFKAGDEVVVFEPSLAVGRGVPYGTPDPVHLLNVRAAGMSAFVDRPAHFAEWYAARIGIPAGEAGPIFAPRCEYGVYVGEILAEAAETSEGRLTVVCQRAQTVEVGNRLGVRTPDGTLVEVDELVVATGHLSPQTPRELTEYESLDRYIKNPWAPGALDAIAPEDSVLILGTGLTMVDAVLSLNKRGHVGTIYARSRRGLVPRPHKAGPAGKTDLSLLDQDKPLSGIIHAIRTAGDDWRAEMDALRPHTQRMWDRLSWKDRKRFIEKLRPFWDVHRHRIPESTNEVLSSLADRGQFQVAKGRLDSVKFEDGSFELSAGGEAFSAQWILNCTGPNLQVSKVKLPILESIVCQELASYDPLGLGLLVDNDGRTKPGGHVWALGPLCRGSRWETTAIPEIRVQAHRIAELIGA